MHQFPHFPWTNENQIKRSFIMGVVVASAATWFHPKKKCSRWIAIAFICGLLARQRQSIDVYAPIPSGNESFLFAERRNATQQVRLRNFTKRSTAATVKTKPPANSNSYNNHTKIDDDAVNVVRQNATQQWTSIVVMKPATNASVENDVTEAAADNNPVRGQNVTIKQQSAEEVKPPPAANPRSDDHKEAVVVPLPTEAMTFLRSMNLTRDDLYERNFFYRAWLTDPESSESHLPPMDVMTRYISQHSLQQLELEWKAACGQQQQEPAESPTSLCRLDSDKSPRRYLVASYSCPIESGNRLHRFMNGLLWAVLTNRTFLWRYQDHHVCEEYNEGNCRNEYDPGLIIGPVDCGGLLERSPWIPSYEDWRDKLGFETDRSDLVKAEVSHSLKNIPHDTAAVPYDGVVVVDDDLGSENTTNTNSVSGPATIDNNEIRLIRTGKQVALNPGGILTDTPANKTKFLVRTENVERLESIRSEGIYFLYGMLFESLFTMDVSLEPPKDLLHKHASSSSASNDTAIRSIFIHSRHPNDGMDEYVYPERFCLQKMLNKTAVNITSIQPPEPCHVYIMSDRPVTVGLLHRQVRDFTHCTSSSRSQAPPADGVDEERTTSNNGGGGISFRSEHGPRAGRGFWEDVALAVHARDGMIAFHMYSRPYNLVRTSTALVREMVDFRRILEGYYQDVFGSGSEDGGVVEDEDNNDDNDDDETENGGRGFFGCQNPWKDDLTDEDRKRNRARRRKKRLEKGRQGRKRNNWQ